MRIAFMVGRFPVLSETFVLDQVTGMIDRGHEVTVLAEGREGTGAEHEDYRRYGLPGRTRYWPGRGGTGIRGIAAAAVRLLRPVADRASFLARTGGDFDAVIAHFGHVGREAQSLRDAGALRGRLATFFHAFDLTVFPRKRGPGVYRDLFARGDLFLPVSEFWARRLRDMGCPPDRTAVHHMGVDCDTFALVRRDAPADGIMRVVSVARLVPKKGLDDAMRAVALARASHPGLEWSIVGEGPERQGLEALRDELGLADAVRFLGTMTRSGIVEILGRTHVLISPSFTVPSGETEGIPVAIMEAMATGMPVLATRHTGIPELVREGVTGFLVEERDVGGLAARLVCLAEDPGRREAMGRAGRDVVKAEFDIGPLNDRLESMLVDPAGR